MNILIYVPIRYIKPIFNYILIIFGLQAFFNNK